MQRDKETVKQGTTNFNFPTGEINQETGQKIYEEINVGSINIYEFVGNDGHLKNTYSIKVSKDAILKSLSMIPASTEYFYLQGFLNTPLFPTKMTPEEMEKVKNYVAKEVIAKRK